MHTMHTTLRQTALHVARQLGTGHTEAVYQSAYSQLLHEQHIAHQTEVPVPVTLTTRVGTVLSVGTTRVDMLVHDTHDGSPVAHVIEFKAAPPKRLTTMMQPAHMQLGKYLRALHKHPTPVTWGHVIGFVQEQAFDTHLLQHVPRVYVHSYDVVQNAWSFEEDVRAEQDKPDAALDTCCVAVPSRASPALPCVEDVSPPSTTGALRPLPASFRMVPPLTAPHVMHLS